MSSSRLFDIEFSSHVSLFSCRFSYEPIHAKIERHFQKQGVVREDPHAYITRFGELLCEPNDVIQQARAVGVLEDLVNQSFPFQRNSFISFF